MNSNFTPTQPDDPEVRITALLLGELTPAEAAAVQVAITQDPALAQLYDRLKRTIGMVEQAHARASAQPRLSESRRQKLLGHFKIIAPKELREPRRRTLRWLIPVSAAAALIILLVAALLPSLARAKAKAQFMAMRSPQQEEALRQRLIESGLATNYATSFGVSRVSEARQVAGRLGAFNTALPENTPATAVRSRNTWGENGTPAQRSRGIEVMARSGSAAAPDSVVGTKPAAPSPANQIYLPTTEPTADDYAASNPAIRGAIAAGASKTDEAARPMMDIRMMMRYGLVPKGFKAVEGAGAAANLGGFAEDKKRQPTPNQPVTALGLAESVGAQKPAQAKSELAPLPLKLPVPAFMGTPTDIPTEAPTKGRLAERIDSLNGSLPGGGGFGSGGLAIARANGGGRSGFAEGGGGGYGGFFGGGGLGGGAGGNAFSSPAPTKVTKLAEPSVANESARLPALGQTMEGRGIIDAGSVAAGKEGQAEMLGTAGAAVTATANDVVAFAVPTEGMAQVESNRGRAGGTYVLTPGQPEQNQTPTLGDNPTMGRMFRREAVRGQANGPLAAPTPAAQPPAAPARKQAGTVRSPENGTANKAELRPGDLFSPSVPAAMTAAGSGMTTAPGSIRDDWRFQQGTAPAAPAPDNGQSRAYYTAAGETPSGGRQAQPAGQAEADFDSDGLLDLAGKPVNRTMGEEQTAFNKALAKADQAVQGIEATAAGNQAAGEVRLRGELSVVPDVAEKAKVTERYDKAGVALGFATAQSQPLVTNGLIRADELEKITDSSRAKLRVVAESKLEKASPVSAEALKGVAVAEEPPVVRRNLAAPEPQPEVACAQNPFSTFSLNVTDVSFKLAAASLEQGQIPDPSTIRSEEFLNAFNYHDPVPAPGLPVAFAWERTQYPFAQNRDLLRLAVQTAARGREAARPLNLVLLLDNSGSMERADRVRIIHETLGVLASQLQPQDLVSVVAFARTPRLWVDGLAGSQAGELIGRVGDLTPDGGTNLEDALNLAYETALRHFLSQGVNRVVLLTDGAANLGDVDPESLQRKVESFRKRGVALDCFGIGWEGYNDDLLEVLSRNGDGRYGFVNTPEEATTEFAAQLTGALQVAAADVKVQVEFNPHRVTVWRQIGYAKHQLTQEQFRDNTVDAAELAAAESGNALYVVEVNPNGDGDLATVRVRYREPATGVYRELEWPVPYAGPAVALDQASPSLRLATVAAAFSEWLVSSPFAGEVTPDALLTDLHGAPEAFAPDPRPTKLEWMIRQAKAISGK